MTIQNTTIPSNLYSFGNGITSSNTFVDVFMDRDPTSNDVQYNVQKKWFNTSSNSFWILTGFTTTNGIITANWQKISSESIVFTANTGSATPSLNNINIFGSSGTKTSGSGSTITISTEGLVSWNIIGTSQTLAVNNGYLCTSGGALSLALPSTSALGDTIRVALNGSTSFTITQGSGQQIVIANSKTTLGATGSIATTGTGDTIEIVCQVANTIWVALSYNGNLTVT